MFKAADKNIARTFIFSSLSLMSSLVYCFLYFKHEHTMMAALSPWQLMAYKLAVINAVIFSAMLVYIGVEMLLNAKPSNVVKNAYRYAAISVFAVSQAMFTGIELSASGSAFGIILGAVFIGIIPIHTRLSVCVSYILLAGFVITRYLIL